MKNTSEVYEYRDAVNQKLENIDDFFQQLNNSDKAITKEFVETSFDLFTQDKKATKTRENVLLVDVFNMYVEELPNIINKKTKKPVSKRTVQSFRTAISYILKFEKHKNKKLLLLDVNLKFHSDFILFLKKEYDLSTNTIGGYVKDIKTFCRYASRSYKISDTVLSTDFFVLREETDAIVLDEKEIDLIFNFDFSENKRFENVRDWQIIGLWTGLRTSDWQKVENITDGFVTITMQKSQGAKVVIPVHWQIKELIKKRGFPKTVSDVEFNRVIKLVCKEIGINKKVFGSRRNPKTNRKESGYFEKYLLIGSHTCRRSFATNLYNADFPSISIMNITGHKTESSFLKYIKVTPKEHAQKLARHWERKYSSKTE